MYTLFVFCHRSLTSIAPPNNIIPHLSPSLADLSNLALHHKQYTMNAISAITSTSNNPNDSTNIMSDASNTVCRRKKTKVRAIIFLSYLVALGYKSQVLTYIYLININHSYSSAAVRRELAGQAARGACKCKCAALLPILLMVVERTRLSTDSVGILPITRRLCGCMKLRFYCPIGLETWPLSWKAEITTLCFKRR